MLRVMLQKRCVAATVQSKITLTMVNVGFIGLGVMGGKLIKIGAKVVHH